MKNKYYYSTSCAPGPRYPPHRRRRNGQDRRRPTEATRLGARQLALLQGGRVQRTATDPRSHRQRSVPNAAAAFDHHTHAGR